MWGSGGISSDRPSVAAIGSCPGAYFMEVDVPGSLEAWGLDLE